MEKKGAYVVSDYARWRDTLSIMSSQIQPNNKY